MIMEKFAKLLNPYEVVIEGPGQSIAEQAARARILFPAMVERSQLHYWRPGMPTPTSRLRYLIGLAVSWSLADLHFADIINEALATRGEDLARADVFDFDDAKSWDALNQYFPNNDLGQAGWHARPIVGKWETGELCRVFIGYHAMAEVLEHFQLPITVGQLIDRMRPVDKKWFEPDVSTII